MQPQRSPIVFGWHEGPAAHSVQLDFRCGGCGGSGRMVNPLWTEYEQALAGGLSPVCPADGEDLWCPDCEGGGMIPTRQGTALLEFLRRYRF